MMFTKKTLTLLKRLTLGFGMLSLAGCGSIPGMGAEKTPSNIYDLTPAASAAMQGAEGRKTVFLDKVNFPAYLDTQKIVVKPDSNEVRYLAEARWSDRAPALISRFIRISLDQDGSLMVVDRDYPALPYDYKLVLDVRDFSAHVEQGGTPEISIEISADLVGGNPTKVAGRKVFTKTISAASDSREAIVSAFQQGLSEISADLNRWVKSKAG